MKRLMTAAGGLLLGTLLGASGPGCAEDCGAFVQCTTDVGLRWVQCGSVHKFNDGTSLKSYEAAYDKCFCSVRNQPCTDGRTLRVCDSRQFDGKLAAIYGDGSETEPGPALASCVGWDTCTRVDTGCDSPYHYYACELGGVTNYLGSDGVQYETQEEAQAACRFPDTNCRTKIATCEELGPCDTLILQDACRGYSYSFGGGGSFCYDYPACQQFKTELDCSEEDACQWTG